MTASFDWRGFDPGGDVVRIFDTTMRDGEQSPGATMTSKEKLEVAKTLSRLGVDVKLVEAQDGHNWENWRDRLRDGLTWLFPGPLWMVYE